MQGFKPKEQRQPQDGNMGRDAVMSAIARQAGQAQQQPERPASESAPVRAMRQVFSGSIFDRRKAAEDQERRATGYANGGMVRGPGTGTSDSIPAEIPEGSYIMPADSTAQLGEEALSSMGRGFKPGRKKVPVNLSNGEYQLPPEQVHAVGVEALNQVKNATHTPVAARGFPVGGQQPQADEPRMFFSQGGSPIDEKRKLRWPDRAAGEQARQAKIEQWKSDVRTPSAPEPAQPPAPPISPQAAADRQAIASAWNTAKGASEDAGRAIADVATLVPRGLVGAYDSAVVRPMRAAGMNAAYLSPSLVPDGVDPASMTPFTDQKRMREAAAPAPNAGAGAGRGSVNPPAVVPSGPAAPAPQTATAPAAQTSLAGDSYMPGADANARPMFDTPAAPASNQVMPGVYQHGRGQYSDNPNGMGFAPGAGNPSANNIAAADALAARSAADVAGTVARGFQPQQAQIMAPQVRHSGNDWQARNDLRNLEVSASSITNQPRWSGHGGRRQSGDVPPAVAAYQAALQTDAELRRAVPAMDQMAMRENAATQRTGMQEQGSNARNMLDNAVRMADVGVRGFDAQARRANDARRASVDERRMTLDENIGNISIRAAQRLESLQNRYAQAKDDTERAAIAREIRDLSGKQDQNAAARMEVVRGSVDPATGRRDGDYAVIFDPNTQTARTVPVDGQGGRQQNFEVGKVYQDANGNRRKWDGEKWQKV